MTELSGRTNVDEVINREETVWGPFAEAVRQLVDACVTSAAEDDAVRDALGDVRSALSRIGETRHEKTFGLTYGPVGRRRQWGNPVIGLRNPIAPPLLPEFAHETRSVTSDFHCGPAYEGPPGLVHGGIVSLILDQMLGHAANAAPPRAMTGTLTVVYHRGTPLGDLRAEAWLEREQGLKKWARGRVIGPDGVTAEAEGVFITPRDARSRRADVTGR